MLAPQLNLTRLPWVRLSTCRFAAKLRGRLEHTAQTKFRILRGDHCDMLIRNPARNRGRPFWSAGALIACDPIGSARHIAITEANRSSPKFFAEHKKAHAFPIAESLMYHKSTRGLVGLFCDNAAAVNMLVKGSQSTKQPRRKINFGPDGPFFMGWHFNVLAVCHALCENQGSYRAELCELRLGARAPWATANGVAGVPIEDVPFVKWLGSFDSHAVRAMDYGKE